MESEMDHGMLASQWGDAVKALNAQREQAEKADAQKALEQARAENERWRKSHTIETARLREARERATAAESALTEAREQLSRLREAVEGLADEWTEASVIRATTSGSSAHVATAAITVLATLADVTPAVQGDTGDAPPVEQEAKRRCAEYRASLPPYVSTQASWTDFMPGGWAYENIPAPSGSDDTKGGE